MGFVNYPTGNIKTIREIHGKINGVIEIIVDVDRAIRFGNYTSESVHDDICLVVF